MSFSFVYRYPISSVNSSNLFADFIFRCRKNDHHLFKKISTVYSVRLTSENCNALQCSVFFHLSWTETRYGKIDAFKVNANVLKARAFKSETASFSVGSDASDLYSQFGSQNNNKTKLQPSKISYWKNREFSRVLISSCTRFCVLYWKIQFQGLRGELSQASVWFE